MLADFEHDIADYLIAEAVRLGETTVSAFFSRIAFQPQAEHPVRDLLLRMETSTIAPQVRAWLEPRLTRTIESFAATHSTG
jgi:hypothetical protein